MKTLADLYAALASVEKGSEMERLIKAEIKRLNDEAAKYRNEKNTADARVKELEDKVKELEEKGTGDQSALSKMQKQLDELNKKYEEAESARKEAETKRQQSDILQQTVAALTKGNAANPSEIAKIIVGSVSVKEDGSYKYTGADGKESTIEEGAAGWLKANSWAVKNQQNPGSGGTNPNNNGKPNTPPAGSLEAAVAAALGK